MIKKHEPELIRAATLKLGVVASTATSGRTRLMLGGMNFMLQTSPHDQARAIRDAVIATFPPSWRDAIFIAGIADAHTFNIEIKRVTPPIIEEAVLAIGKAFQQAFPGYQITLNTWWTLAEAAGAVCAAWTPDTWPEPFRSQARRKAQS